MNNTYKRLLGLVVNNRNDEGTAISQPPLPARNKARASADNTLELLNLSPEQRKIAAHRAVVMRLRHRTNVSKPVKNR